MQNSHDYILRFYSSKYLTARRRYREYVKKALADCRRPELVGGGLVRSAGGWSVVKAMRRGFEWMKGDERILGDGDFVETVLKKEIYLANSAGNFLKKTLQIKNWINKRRRPEASVAYLFSAFT